MKQLIITIAALLLLPLAVMAQYEEDTENGVVSLNGKEGFTIATKKGDFVFKPYMLVQTSANINYYDDEGLDPAYNQDNIHNSGFSIPYAILGFTGKAFDRVTFNLSINAAGNGGNILQQAWFDVEIKKSFAIRCRQVQDSVLARLPDYAGRDVNADTADIAHLIRDPALFS